MVNVSFVHLGLVGRLGNALYQLAATAGIADTMGVEPRFNANWIHRPYFSVPDEFFTDHATSAIPAHETPLAQHIDERCRIYLQDYNLFAHILPTLREWLAPSPLARDIMAADPQVAEFGLLEGPVLSVHVRRGDNAPGGDPETPDKHLYHPMPDLAYYQAAIAAAEDRLAYPDWQGERPPEVNAVAVFSDDPDWCADNIEADYHHYGVGRPKEHQPDYLTAPVLDWIDWQLQVRCDRHVCSNSTFGIMAAVISGDEHAIVPWPIFGPRLRYIDAGLMFPYTYSRLPGDRRASRPR